jgi:hypothetical protein
MPQDWATDIIQFLGHGLLPSEKKEAQKSQDKSCQIHHHQWCTLQKGLHPPPAQMPIGRRSKIRAERDP